MCSRYADTQCCVCRRLLGNSNNRIIVEICGHQKCRECFIKEEDGCSLCNQNKQQISNEVQCVSSNIDVPSSSNELRGDITARGDTNDTKTLVDVSHIVTVNENGKAVCYKCTICEKTFKSRNNRKYHLFCDKNRSKPFQCSQCGKQFITQAHMNYHQSTHNTDKSFACPHCQKVYSGEIALKKHLKKHQNDFKYQCSQCEEKFLYKEQLNIHQNRHNNIYHNCPECGKAFLIKSNLTKHIQSHTGINRKTCAICKNTFSGNSALKTHMLTHSNSKPHHCEKCAKKFIDQRTLERHWKTHTDTAFYECTLCSAKSGRKDNIRRHVRNLHSESEEELRLILEKIFENFANKKNGLNTGKITHREKKTETKAAKSATAGLANTIPVANKNVLDNPNRSVVRNIATSVIKFVGRTQDVLQPQTEEIQPQSTHSAPEPSPSNTSEKQQTRHRSIEQLSQSEGDPIAETGVNLPSLEPLNLEPFPHIVPLPFLNTNTNLTVYRQLLSPYLKKPSNTSTDGSGSSSMVPANTSLKPGTSMPMVIDRPPKKMIEKYEVYRS